MWDVRALRAILAAAFVLLLPATSLATSNHTITVDASMSDWSADEIFSAYSSTDLRITWDASNIYIGWQKGSTLVDSDVIWVYFDVQEGGTFTSANWGSGTHTLPFAADTFIAYQPNGTVYDIFRENGGAWVWVSNTFGSKAQDWGGGKVELSLPRSMLGSPSSCSAVLMVMNNDNDYVYSVIPSVNDVGPPTTDFDAYIFYPLTAGISQDDARWFRSKRTWTLSPVAIPSFTPVIDGVKDGGWGSTPNATSPITRNPQPGQGDTNAAVPSGGLARDVYVTNDAQWLYIGWKASGDPYQLETDQSIQAAHYAFGITDTSSWGSAEDPFKSTVRITGYGADVWLNGWIGYLQDWTQFERRTTNGRTWNPVTVLTEGLDWKVAFDTAMDGWGEIRVPLSMIGPDGVVPGETVGLIHTARYSAAKQGINDMTPYDGDQASDWANNAAFIIMSDTRVIPVRIQQGVVDGFHVPDSTPVPGRGAMRQPTSPTVQTPLSLRAAAGPNGVLASATVYYSTDNFANTSTASLAYEFASGGYDYWSGYLPALQKGMVLKYFFALNSDKMTTYVYGNDSNSFRTSVLATAQAGAFAETIGNAAPTAPPDVEVTPRVAPDDETLTATASNATDADTGDSLTYVFVWRQNGVDTYTTYDSTAPYTSLLPPGFTQVGDTWQVKVAAGDGTETSSYTAGPTALISGFVAWDGTLPTEENAGAVSSAEWIWRDKDHDGRDPTSNDLELAEARVQADATYVYLLARFGGSISGETNFVAFAFDTDLAAGSGGVEIGDQSATYLGSGISSPSARWEAQVVLHETAPGGGVTAEVDSGLGWRTPGDLAIQTTKAAGIVEARIRRSDLLLEGNAAARVSVATFWNNRTPAATSDATFDFWGPDATDAASLAQDEGNDTDGGLTAYNEDLFDSDLDLWFEIRLDATGVLANSTPPAPGSIAPPNGSSITDQTPTLSWGAVTDPDAPNDTVVSYLVELAESVPTRSPAAILSETVSYRIVETGTSWTVPSNIADSTTYVWRVRARDRKGALGAAATQSFFIENTTEILTDAPRDDQNLDNFGIVNGEQVAGTSATWRWAPATHSKGYRVDTYTIQVSSDPLFASIHSSAVVDSATRRYVASGLARGAVYYARVRGYDTGGFTGNWSATSDGLYVSRRQLDGDSADWAPDTGYADTAAYAIGGAFQEGYWADQAGDQRSDSGGGSPSPRDLTQFKVTGDSYNLYLLIALDGWNDGDALYQVAVSTDFSSSERVFEGYNDNDEDAMTSAEAAWEWLLRIRTGNDDVYLIDPSFRYAVIPGAYKENAGQKFVEVAVPLDRMGGARLFKNRSVGFSVATFARASGGGVGDITGACCFAAVVDAVTATAGNTWNDIQDRVLNYYVTATFNETAEVTAFTGTATTSPLPTLPSDNGAPNSSNLHWIMYNVFVDRFYSGASDNQPSDGDMTGGDFEGLIERIEYIQDLGVNVIYLGPSLDFGGGAWGYNQSDLYRIQWSFTDMALGGNSGDYNARYGFRSLAELVRQAHRRNMEVFIDWIPGQVYQGRTVTNHPEIFSGKRFGGERVQQDMVEARQFFSDHARFLWSQGIRGFRVDNPKFYPDDYTTGHPFFRYVRDNTDEFAPELYTFGEVPDNASVTGSFCCDGSQLSGMLDFPMLYNIQQYARGNQSASTFKANILSTEASYTCGVTPIMAWFFENHDHSRTYHQVGGGGDNDGSKQSWVADNMRAGYHAIATSANNPVIFYGDEFPIDGWHSWTYPFPGAYTTSTGKFGNTRAINWSDNQFPWYQGYIRKFFSARAIFPALRGANSGRNWVYDDGFGKLGQRRQWGGGGNQEKVIAVTNAQGVNATDVWADGEADGTIFEDWVEGTSTTVSGGNLTPDDPAKNGRIWVKGGFGRSTVRVNAGYPDVIVTLDHDTLYDLTAFHTRKTDATGWVTIDSVVTDNAATTPYTLTFWRPGYAITDSAVSITPDAAPQTIVIQANQYVADAEAPATPTGLSAVPRDGAAVLTWNPNSERDFESYYLYRAQNASGPWTMVAECFQPTFYDNDYDNGLVNGTGYYYRVAARDRNGNLSGQSATASCTPTTYLVRWYLYTEGASADATYWIAGNHEGLGEWNPQPMTEIADDLWYFALPMDPTSRPEYKFVVKNSSGTFWEGSFSNELLTGNRLARIVDHTGTGQTILTHRWNVAGDTAPRRVSAASADGTETFIAVGWQPNIEPDVVRYRVYRSTDAFSTWTSLGYVGAGQNQYFDTSVLGGGQTYWYRIAAVDWYNIEGQWSEAGAAQLSSADTRAPDSPTGVALQPAGLAAIKLTWNLVAAGDLAGYDVYRSTDPAVPIGPATLITTSSVTPSLSPQYIDSGVTPGVRYYYRVTAVDDSGNVSAPSDTVTAMLVTVSFRVDMASIGPSSVQVYGDPPTITTSGKNLTQVSTTDWSETFGLFAGVTYRFRYRYTKGASTTAEENFASTSTGDREYAPPEAASVFLTHDWEEDPGGPIDPAGYPGDRRAYLSWTADSGADVVGYHVYRASSANDSYVRITSSPVTATGYIDSGLSNGNTYFYIVKSIDGGSLTLESRAVKVLVVTPEAPVWIRFRVDATPPERRRGVG